MKNPFKQYFLFLSQGPFVISLVGFIVIFILSLSPVLFINEETLAPFFSKFWPALFLFSIVNMCSGYFIRRKYITTCNSKDDYDNTLFSVLVTREGKKIILTKSVWKTGKRYWITSQNYSSLLINKDGAKGQTKTICFINGKYNNSLVKIPVTLTLKYKGPIDQISIFDSLIENISNSEILSMPDSLSLVNYLEKVFFGVNEQNQPKFDEIINRHAQLKISDTDFLNELVDVIEFPEKIFSCIVSTYFSVGKPKISACKEVKRGK